VTVAQFYHEAGRFESLAIRPAGVGTQKYCASHAGDALQVKGVFCEDMGSRFRGVGSPHRDDQVTKKSRTPTARASFDQWRGR
jgi:hypothetical protein